MYLKSGGVDPTTWRNWIGVAQGLEAQRLQPTQRLASGEFGWLACSTPMIPAFSLVGQRTDLGRWLAVLERDNGFDEQRK